MFNEQGRPQIKRGWGSPKSPISSRRISKVRF
ncbi:hypothetical protein [Campylobacter jejuni]